MGRGLAILAVFALLIGAAVYWGPLRLSVAPAGAQGRGRQAESNRSSASAAPEHGGSATELAATRLAPVRKTENGDPRSREPVLTATASIAATSPLAALPEKAIPGFPLTPRSGIANEQLASALKQAKHLRGDGQLTAARDLLSDVYLGHRLTREQRVRLADELEPLAAEILRSPHILDHGQLYQVEPGDVLVKIARPMQVPAEFIMKLNGLRSARSIRPRQSLKIVQGPFDVLVELTEFELAVLHHGKFVRRFPIGVGRDETPTPPGLYRVTDRQQDPTKWPDSVDRRTLPPHHPENPLGSRWLGIGLGYGIHGTIEPDTIGQKSSRGCIRMRNQDVEELYDMLTESSRVLIRG